MSTLNQAVEAAALTKKIHDAIAQKALIELLDSVHNMKKCSSNTDYEKGIMEGFERGINKAIQCFSNSAGELDVEEIVNILFGDENVQV